MAFFHLRQYDSALAYFDSSLARDPDLVLALSNRGIVNQQMGRTAAARHDLQAVVQMGTDPGLSADARRRLARLRP